MDGSSDAPASSEQRAPAAALDLKDLNYFIIEAVNHNEPKARQLTEVLRDQQAIFSLADFRDCVRIDADGLRADILSALTKEKPGALRVWRAHLATLFDRALHSTASASASVAPSSPASVSPGSTSPVSKYSHFPWKHLSVVHATSSCQRRRQTITTSATSRNLAPSFLAFSSTWRT